MLRVLCAAACLVLVQGADAGARSGPQGADFETVIASGDPAVYAQAIASDAYSGPQADLLRGALAAMLNRDGEAETRLAALKRDETLAPSLRREASLTLAGVRLRAGDYAASVIAYDAAEAASGEALEPGQRQARDLAAALRDEPAMTREALIPGSVSMRRDRAGLPRARVQVNGRRQDMVIDTGAAFSTVTESTAERLGVRMLDSDISVGSSVEESVPGRLGVANQLDFGGVIFHNVVFIVLPDEALSFAGGAYRIPAILGLPVLARLERLRITPDGRRETLDFELSTGGGPPPNMVMEGLRPVLLARVEASEGRLRLMIDTGARATLLYLSAGEAIPGLLHGVEASPTRLGGAGGVRVDEDAMSLPRLTLLVADQSVTLEDVRMLSHQQSGLHGLLGQDVLRARSGYLIDFTAMRLELLDG
ncbi:hypothetical protein F1654_09955 [Alkalicaulis satelles]|uniref:Peptidase A2 domain-containing protein n=1 Tax=Alkalicaulis satelles TaxID=2609175 RepID=A0A5M6ZLJ0_9PROT|nr:retropepsin-like aspartic protease [Alkalicaulis satelles]KAA5804088.1 hypothetical protein F1654_09955 [Alkalicaulis satelles]